jgi:hypothetical protein
MSATTITLYAKSLSGDVIPVSVPTLQTWHEIHPRLAAVVCPDDPSRLVLLPLPNNESESESESGTESDDEKETIYPTWGLFREWKEGDSLLYMIKDLEPFQISYTKCICKIEEDDRTKAPYYVIDVYIEPLNCNRSFGWPASCHYRYQFLYSLQNNHFIHRSNYTLDEDEQWIYLTIRDNATYWTSPYEMIQSDESIPSRFHYALYRSIYRKWSTTLRRFSRSMKNPLRRRMTNQPLEERKQLLDAYWSFRNIPPPYPRKTDTMMEY